MPNKILRSPRARLDLIDIWTYIAQDNPEAADTLLDRFGDVFNKLAKRPLIGRHRPELGSDFRSFPIGNYIAFYRPQNDGIEIIRILSRYRDIDAETVTDERS